MRYEVKDTTNITYDYGAELLKSRGIEDIAHFLNPTQEHSLQSWIGFSNIKEAAKLIRETLKEENPKFALVVDSDVDGYTSAAIIYQYLKEVDPTIQIDYYLHEGKQHGLSDTYERIIDSNINYDICLLPDSGSNDFEYIEKLGEYNIKTVILDHHIIEETTQISKWCIIVNNQNSPNYHNKDLSGAGVTYQFCRALDYYLGNELSFKYIDLAALGICADMMSALSEENQYFWKTGFSHINNFFFRTLCDKQDYSMGGKINPTTVAFYIVPLINAMIRVGTAAEKERLFNAFVNGKEKIPSGKRGAKGTLEFTAVESARECTNAKAHQDKRKAEIVDKLEIKIAKHDLLENKVLFIRLEDDDDFPAELNGLVAMQLSAKHNCPTIVARLNEEGYIRGSARGVNQSELKSFKNFLNSTDLFEYTVGHDNAFGISIKNSDLSEFHKIANEELKDLDFGETVYVVDFARDSHASDLKDIISDLSQYEFVWGQMNTEPLLAIKNIVVNKSDISVIGRNKDTIRI